MDLTSAGWEQYEKFDAANFSPRLMSLIINLMPINGY